MVANATEGVIDSTEVKKFWRVLRWLRRTCPLGLPVSVRCKDLRVQQLCGCCYAYINTKNEIYRFVIEIDCSLGRVAAVDTLLHEWAHALDQVRDGIAAEPHRESWGSCFAEIWRNYSGYF